MSQRPRYVTSSILIVFLGVTFTSCEKRQRQAHALVQNCKEKFSGDADKQHWCLGECEKVEDAQYRSICQRVKEKN